MAGSRRSPQADVDGARVLLRAVDRALSLHLQPGARVVVALSGGRDSVALLDAAAASKRIRREDLVAVHVHHGLSPHAQRWAEFCARLATSMQVTFDLRRVNAAVRSREGVESRARSLRYAALRDAAHEHCASTVLLAHHQDDQAETVLLQLLRGAGVHGLAAMPEVRTVDGITWLRPMLRVTREQVDAYVRSRDLAYVDDESNASTRHRRNALRHRVLPSLRELAGGFPATLARAATHQAEAAQLIDELATLDIAPLLDSESLDRKGLAALPPHRARNVLRHFLRLHGLRPPSTARLAAMHDQLTVSRGDASVRLTHDGRTLGIHRGRIVVHRVPPVAYARAWRGESSLDLPHGRLDFVPTRDRGLCVAHRDAGWTVRPRAGGERFQPFATRPRRALKSWLQEASVPSWEREALPLVFHGEDLVAVPGFGVDVAYQAKGGEAGLALVWRPFP